MTSNLMAVEPQAIADLVEDFVNDEHEDDRKYTNRAPLDSSGVWTLHQLAAEIYAIGFNDGLLTSEVRARGAQVRRGRRDEVAT